MSRGTDFLLLVYRLQFVHACLIYKLPFKTDESLSPLSILPDLCRQRLIDTRGYFLLLHDSRLFRSELRYIWNRIVNVVFVQRYNVHKYRSGQRVAAERIDLSTVYYPSHTRDLVTIKHIDTWRDGKLRYGTDHYVPKTTDLHGNDLRSVIINSSIQGIRARATPSGRKSDNS